MSTLNTTLSAIQLAGQTLHNAYNEATATIQSQMEKTLAVVRVNPFNADGDRAFTAVRTISKLAQDILVLEEKLKQIYLDTERLLEVAPSVVLALPSQAAQKTRATRASVQDVVEKPAAKDKAVKAVKATKLGKAAKRKAMVKPPRPNSNGEKVLNYFRAQLNALDFRPVTQATIATGAGIPVGSVGAQIQKAIAMGVVIEGVGGQKGSFKLVA